MSVYDLYLNCDNWNSATDITITDINGEFMSHFTAKSDKAFTHYSDLPVWSFYVTPKGKIVIKLEVEKNAET